MSDPFLEVSELLFGGGADELVTKMNPAQSDLAAAQDKRKRKITAGLSAVGAAAGAAGLTLGGHNVRRAYMGARYGMKAGKAIKPIKGVTKPIATKKEAVKSALKHEKLATGLVPLEVAGLTGEVAATRILHGDTKKKPVSKSDTEILNNAKDIPATKGQLTMAVVSNPKVQKKGMEYTKKGAGMLRRLPNPITTNNKVDKAFGVGAYRAAKQTGRNVRDTSEHLNRATKHLGDTSEHLSRISERADRLTGKAGVIAGTGIGVGAGVGGAGVGYAVGTKKKSKLKPIAKRETEIDVVWDAEITKADADKQQIFGWASVVEVNGEPVVDLQGDYISTDEMEKAGYEYVMKSRKGGDMHLRNDWSPIQKSEMIESFIVTPEKRDALGLPDSVPSGWWVGFQVQDPEVWAKVRSGERTGFSIHGRGKRESV